MKRTKMVVFPSVLVIVMAALLLRTSTAGAKPAAPCGAWSVVSSPNVGPNSNLFNSVAAIGVKNVWAVGNYLNSVGVNQTLVEKWNGTTWTVVPSPNVGVSSDWLYGVAAISANDVWAVGQHNKPKIPSKTLTEHWNGRQWSIVSSADVSGLLTVDEHLFLCYTFLMFDATFDASLTWVIRSETRIVYRFRSAATVARNRPSGLPT